jgi:hypothetical protein
MESITVRISKYALDEVQKYGKEVDSQTIDTSLRYILSELKRLRELEGMYKEKLIE